MVLSAGKILQCAVGFPELCHLLLYLLQQLLGLTDGLLLLEPDQLLRLAALLLNGVDQFGEGPLALLGRCCRRVLQSLPKVKMLSASIEENKAKNKTHLDVADNVSKFFLCDLQILLRRQRGFLQLFLVKRKR